MGMFIFVLLIIIGLAALGAYWLIRGLVRLVKWLFKTEVANAETKQ